MKNYDDKNIFYINQMLVKNKKKSPHNKNK